MKSYTGDFIWSNVEHGRAEEKFYEKEYSGREGVIEHVSPAYEPAGILEQLHGTWGGLAVQPELDTIEMIQQGE